jgi:hypothetical protein
VDDAVATPEDTAVGVDVRVNDSDADGDPLTVTSFTQGAQAAVSADGDLLVYTPPANFAGTDSFQYTLADGNGGSDTASVVVTVTAADDAPVAVADSYRTPPGTTLTVRAGTGVLANDSDPDGDALSAVLVAGPAQGVLSLAADGSFTYVPTEDATGAVTFTYRALDPTNSPRAVATVTIVVQVGDVPVSTCRPVIPAAVHRVKTTGVDFMGEPFLGNRRLALIEDGTVPCVEVDTLEVTRCAFWTSSDSPEVRVARRDSGPWLGDVEGRRWAVVGQPVTRDGSLAHGAFIVGTTPDADGSAPCIVSSGHDSAGTMSGTDLAATCVQEVAGSETNASGLLLRNYTTRFVGTTSVPHPDALGAPVSFDPITGVAWYTGEGAAVNDMIGERDHNGTYYGQDWSCHLIVSGGVQVPAAKRPSTVSYPKPGFVNVHSRIRWQTMNPYVQIANDSPVDPRIGTGPEARFTHVVGVDSLSLDGSHSRGEIMLYTWDLEWTPNPGRVLGFAGHRDPARPGRGSGLGDGAPHRHRARRTEAQLPEDGRAARGAGGRVHGRRDLEHAVRGCVLQPGRRRAVHVGPRLDGPEPGPRLGGARRGVPGRLRGRAAAQRPRDADRHRSRRPDPRRQAPRHVPCSQPLPGRQWRSGALTRSAGASGCRRSAGPWAACSWRRSCRRFRATKPRMAGVGSRSGCPGWSITGVPSARYVDARLDRSEIARGDVAWLTLRVVRVHPRGMSVVGLISRLGTESHLWPIAVSMR